MIIGKFIAAAIIAYLIGAVPFGLIIGRLLGNVDITKRGSGNIGGTNVIRTVGTKSGILVIVLDMAKAAAAVLLARTIVGDSVLLVAGVPLNYHYAQIAAALTVMVGHNWSIYIKFRGGKGSAAYFGGWFAINPAVAFFGGLILFFTVIRTRYMSIGSLLGSVGIFFLLIFLTLGHGFPLIYLIYSFVAAAIIIYQHRSNIGRLQTGTEHALFGKLKKRIRK